MALEIVAPVTLHFEHNRCCMFTFRSQFLAEFVLLHLLSHNDILWLRGRPSGLCKMLRPAACKAFKGAAGTRLAHPTKGLLLGWRGGPTKVSGRPAEHLRRSMDGSVRAHLPSWSVVGQTKPQEFKKRTYTSTTSRQAQVPIQTVANASATASRRD